MVDDFTYLYKKCDFQTQGEFHYIVSNGEWRNW